MSKHHKFKKLLAEVQLAAEAGDNELAHTREIALREKILKALARHPSCGSEARELVRIALATGDIKFSRRTA